MSDQDNADRLNREWDDFVQSPRDARRNNKDIDPTIGELFAMDDPQSPDPEFRMELRRRLLRENAFISGQQRAATGHPQTGMAPVPEARHFHHWLELVVIAVVVVAIGTALIWATQIRGDRDENVTPTFQLAATSPGQILGTPQPSSTPSIPATPPDSQPTEPSVAISPTEQASPTTEADICANFENRLVNIVATLASPGLPPELTSGTLSGTEAVLRAKRATTEFSDCLELISPTDAYALVQNSLEGQGVSILQQATLTQQVVGLTAPGWTVSDVKTHPNNLASALITLSDGTQFVGIFDSAGDNDAIELIGLYVPKSAVSTVPADIPASNPPPPSGDESDDDDSGVDDDDGGDDDD